MATKSKLPVNELSTEEKISVLYDLQQLDSKVDSINHIKGELPFEVEDFENLVNGLETRISNYTSQFETLNKDIKSKKEDIETSLALIKKYEKQLEEVRNNREFDSLSKEVEYQKLEIELAEKHIKEFTVEVKVKKKQIEDAKSVFDDRKIDLEAKRAELAGVEADTAQELVLLKAASESARAKIEDRLLATYDRTRKNVRNGLAVVTVKRDACGGCFNRIPPQRQLDIRTSKKIIVCEYCGRILVSDLMNEDEGADTANE